MNITASSIKQADIEDPHSILKTDSFIVLIDYGQYSGISIVPPNCLHK